MLIRHIRFFILSHNFNAMLTIISPAKLQNFDKQDRISDFTQPLFLKEAKSLVKQLRSYSTKELAHKLQVNSKIAEENVNRYLKWTTPFTPENAKQAVFAYNGEVYRGLDARSLTNDEIFYLQSHLRMMTGLYGILRPLDLIQPYRLEVKTKLLTETGKDLYSFWRPKVTKEITKSLKMSDNPDVLLNLASSEYTKMIDKNKLKARVIEFDFLQYYPDMETYKPIVIYLKKARGLMARYVAQNRLTNPDDLKGFSANGYWYSEKFSSENKMVFVR
ncbi:MAG: peroxide stress protein YaaA [Paludibacteraceae bacterium]